MKRNVIKIVSLLLVAILCVTVLTTIVNGAGEKTISFRDVDTQTVTESAQDSSGAAGLINQWMGAALTIVQVVGVGVAVIMLIILAIKYISAAPSDKAEIKKHAVVYVVGAIVLFAASGILQLIKTFANQANETFEGTGGNN